MAIIAVMHIPGMTKEKYEESVRLIAGRSRMEKPSDWPVKGLLAHVAGQSPTGFRVIDVWDSEQAFQQFGEKLIPVLNQLGVEAQPEVYQAHTVVTAGS